MSTLESMRRRIGSAQDLYSVVRVMKALAAANIRQCEKSVEAIGLYNQTIEQGFQVLMRSAVHAVLGASVITESDVSQQAGKRTALIVCGSDQGMCGSFNEQIVMHALQEIEQHRLPIDQTPILSVGLRLVGRLQDARGWVHRSYSLPSSIATATETVQQLFLAIDQLRADQQVEQFWVIHHRLTSVSGFAPHTAVVLPISFAHLQTLAQRPWPSRSLPTFAMDGSALLSMLVRQHLYAVLHRALAESMASENASRLASMQAAEKNIEEHLEKLQFAYHQKRQQTITEELLDIVAGFELLQPESDPDRHIAST